jgi:two-component sensor histidine kinase/ABC-type nitrate/sulfonate/bicarbonate transport system substrate-binding protein
MRSTAFRLPLRRSFIGWLFLVLPALHTPAQEVVLQLRWAPQFQFAGYYAAKWQGYYEDAGLTVELRSALDNGSILSATEAVARGDAHFGIGAADILLEHATGREMTVVASIFQESAAALYSLADTELDSPDDLLDLTRARIEGGLIDMEVRAMMLLEGLDPDGGRTVPLEPGIGALLQGEIDVIPGYQITAPWIFEEHGHVYRELRPSSFGVKFYGDSLFTTAELAQSMPELVARFRDASLRGWKYALTHVEEVSERLAEVDRDGDPIDDALRFNRWQATQVRMLTQYPEHELGHVNANRWRYMHELLVRLGIVSGQLDIDSFVFSPDRMLAERRERRLIAAAVIAVSLFIVAGMSTAWSIALRRKVKERTLALRQSLSQRDQLFKELNHRVKNNLAMVSSLLRLKDTEAGDTVDLSDVQSQVASIGKVHEYLSHVEGSMNVSACKYIRDVVTSTLETTGSSQPELELHLDNIHLSSKTAVTIGLIVSELATNAAKYGFEPHVSTPRFTVRFGEEREREQYVLTVSNTGKRFPEEVEPDSTSTLGLKLVSELVGQLDGSISLDREPITTFEIRIPTGAAG